MSTGGREVAVILSTGKGCGEARSGSDEPGPEAPWRMGDGLFSSLRTVHPLLDSG